MVRFLGFFLAVALLAGSGHAEFLIDYGTPVIVELPETGGMTDITAVYATQDATHWYFRIDLDQAPSGYVSYDEYAIFMDTDLNPATGAQGSQVVYVPDGINGIDRIVDIHWENASYDWEKFEGHIWNPNKLPQPAFDKVTFDPPEYMAQTTENGGKSLEMKVAKEFLPNGPGKIYAGVQLAFNNLQTADTTGSAVPVPEPSSFLLLLGVASCVGLLWRRQK